MSVESFLSFLSVAIGFAVAGLFASAYQLATERPANFNLIERKNVGLAALPFLMFAAPFLIIRNTVMGGRFEQRPFGFVTLATIIAGCWALLSGTVVVTAVQALAHLLV